MSKYAAIQPNFFIGVNANEARAYNRHQALRMEKTGENRYEFCDR